MLKLDLGAGAASPPGFTPMGRAHGTEIYPLPHEDGSVDEIRASHVLEHFPSAQVPLVLQNWADKLKPGGAMKIAVPDFEWIAKAYDQGQQVPIEGYVLGGQRRKRLSQVAFRFPFTWPTRCAPPALPISPAGMPTQTTVRPCRFR
jgi:SAM-dependent methyltransferase